jgi:hypothetical protein
MEDGQFVPYWNQFDTYVLRELVWYKPCHNLIHNFSLVVYTLDRQESFP